MGVISHRTSAQHEAHVKLLVFSVTLFKIDQNKKSKPFNRLSPEPGNRKKIYIQSLLPRFGSQQFFLWKICGETFSPQIYRDLYGNAMLVPTYMGTNMAAGNQQKHLSLSFATKA